ncbi:MAG TPA: hypothetical protein PKH93_02400, partial [Chitinophagales bacterium]|nr:hypothetical protein [Chitinophagales bacterium]
VYSDNTIDATITNTITPLVVSYIQTNMPIANNRTRELQTVLRKKGISQHIDELKIGEKCTIHIGFRTQQVNNTFIDKLDTEKMIYRLCIIGLIDDYTVDFNNKEFIMHITKKPDHDYLKSLREYIELYYSDQVANSELRKLTTYNGTVLKKCIHFLIDFVYREIAQKRRLAIDTMKQACIEGLKDNGTQETKENGSKTFREFLDYYFRSKYARKGYQENGRNQSLSDRTMVGRYQSIECVWEFMEITKGNIENLKHLRGACLRMLQDQPKNASLLMLKSFAVFLLEGDNKNSEIIDDAIESFSNGIENFMPNFGYSEEKRDIFMDKFKSYLLMYSQNDNIITLIDEIIDGYNLHKLLNSLQKLTNSYLKDYGKY